MVTQDVYEGIRLFVMDQHGRLGDAAHALILHFAGNRARAAALAWQAQYQVADWRALQKIRGIISCMLTRSIGAALRECDGGAADTPPTTAFRATSGYVVVLNPKGPKIEKIPSRLKTSILTFRIPHKK